MALARLAATVLVVALLGATAAAFAVTEGLKLTPSPIRGTQVDKVFSPVCRCPTRVAHIRFRLRRADRLTLVIVDRDGAVVRTLVDGRRYSRGRHGFVWNGRDDVGQAAPDGVYRARVHLAHAHRTILLPNPIQLDTKPPTAILSIGRRVLTPGLDKIRAGYRLSEPARPLLLVDGHIVVRGRFERPQGKLDWYGTGFAAGSYRVALEAVDLAGNVGPRTQAVPVQIVYVALARHRLRVAPGAPLSVRFGPVEAVRWHLDGRTGVARGGRLRIQAPLVPGRYTLFVSYDGHADRAAVVVAP